MYFQGPGAAGDWKLRTRIAGDSRDWIAIYIYIYIYIYTYNIQHTTTTTTTTTTTNTTTTNNSYVYYWLQGLRSGLRTATFGIAASATPLGSYGVRVSGGMEAAGRKSRDATWVSLQPLSVYYYY